MEKNVNIQKFVLDSNRKKKKKNSTSNEPVFVEFRVNFDSFPSQRLVFEGSQKVLRMTAILLTIEKSFSLV